MSMGMSFECQLSIIESLREDDAMFEREEFMREVEESQRRFEFLAQEWEDDDWS